MLTTIERKNKIEELTTMLYRSNECPSNLTRWFDSCIYSNDVNLLIIGLRQIRRHSFDAATAVMLVFITATRYIDDDEGIIDIGYEEWPMMDWLWRDARRLVRHLRKKEILQAIGFCGEFLQNDDWYDEEEEGVV